MHKNQKISKRDYTEQDLQRLLNFYLACIEEEDLRSLTLRLSQLHRSFLSPWEELEPLFNPNASEIKFETKYKSDKSMLLRGMIQAGEPQRLFYGYPIFLDSEDYIAPLFFTEVEIRQVKDNKFILHPTDPEGIHLNHHFLRQQHVEVEEIRDIQEYLEGSFGSFGARLKATYEYIGVTKSTSEEGKLDEFPGKESLRDAWYNCPILFRSQRSVYTIHIRRELDALSKYPRFLNVAMSTSLGNLLSLESDVVSPKIVKGYDKQLIEIKPLNMNQEMALQSGMAKPLTVITGPPGTGKSQVVVNLLANAVIRGKSVLFASKNNKAVDVVRSWLREILGQDYDWTFRVGSRVRMDELEEEMTTRLDKLSQYKRESSYFIDRAQLIELIGPYQSWTLGIERRIRERMDELEKEIISVRSQIKNTLQKLKKLGDTINELREVEALIPETWVSATSNNIEFHLDRNLIDKLIREIKALASGKGLGFRLWFLKLIFGYRLMDRYFKKLKSIVSELPPSIKYDIEKINKMGLNWINIFQKFQKLFHYIHWLSCRYNADEILISIMREEKASELLTKLNDIKGKKAFLSQRKLRDLWTDRIHSDKDKVQHLIKRYFNLSKKLLHVRGRDGWLKLRDDFEETCRQLLCFFPVWIVTNLSARRALPLTENLFDLVVIDEASKCDIASALPILFRAKRSVIIGDPHQLRHISTLSLNQEAQIAEATESIPLLSDLPYISNSLYDAGERAIVRTGRDPIFLSEHYRSHPEIIDFSNRTFYSSSLILRTKIPWLSQHLGKLELGLFWHDVKSKVPYTFRSAYNEEEIKEIVKTLALWFHSGLLSHTKLTIGIVTPFRLQMERIEKAILKLPWFEKLKDRIRVGTAHRFQGDEADLVFYSPVVSEGIHPRKARWVSNTDQLMNVSITRARGALHVFGNSEECQKSGGFLGAFAEYAIRSRKGFKGERSFRSPAEEKLAEILDKLGLWYSPQYKEGRYNLDFFVVSPFGTQYDLEVDGRQHWAPEQFNYDGVRDKVLENAGYKIIRITAGDIFKKPKAVNSLLSRLV